jgi:hypothetical protein
MYNHGNKNNGDTQTKGKKQGIVYIIVGPPPYRGQYIFQPENAAVQQAEKRGGHPCHRYDAAKVGFIPVVDGITQ